VSPPFGVDTYTLLRLPGVDGVAERLRCDHIAQAEAPSRPIARGFAGPALLAHVLLLKCTECGL